MDVNKFKIQGRIARKFRGDGFLSLIVAVRDDGAHTNFPRITFLDKKMLDDIYAEYDVGDYVCVSGAVQTSRVYNTQLIGSSIDFAKPDFEAGLQSGRLVNDINEVRFAGTINHVFEPNDNITVITLKTEVDQRVYFPTVTLFGNSGKQFAGAADGTQVQFLGRVQTKRVTDGEKTKHFESFVGYMEKV